VSAIAPGGALSECGRQLRRRPLGRRQSRRESRRQPFSSTQINLSWTDAATNETGYRIERRLTSDTVTISAESGGRILPPTATSYQNTGLAELDRVHLRGFSHRPWRCAGKCGGSCGDDLWSDGGARRELRRQPFSSSADQSELDGCGDERDGVPDRAASNDRHRRDDDV
jgi:hypothetical protein